MTFARSRAGEAKAIRLHTLAASLIAGAAGSFVADAMACREVVGFAENYAEGVRYAPVNRGNIREEVFTSRAAIDAVRARK